MIELIGGYVDGCPDERWELDEGTYRNVQAEYTRRLNELKQSDKGRNVVVIGDYINPQHTTLAHVIKQQIKRARNGNFNQYRNNDRHCLLGNDCLCSNHGNHCAYRWL